MVTLATLYKINGTEKPFLLDSIDLNTFPWLSDYSKTFKEIDRIFIKQKGFYYPLTNKQYSDNENELLDEFKADVKALFYYNAEKYKRLFEVYTIEYNPIHNYDRTEHQEFTKNGQEINVDSIGKKSDTTINGERNATNTNGTQTNTTTNENTTYTNDNLHINDKQTNINGEYTINVTEQEYTTTVNSGEQENTHKLSFNDRKDISDIQISGNIGVTTTQDMINSQVELFNKFNFYSEIFRDITLNLCFFSC